jgi:hypothetical protein
LAASIGRPGDDIAIAAGSRAASKDSPWRSSRSRPAFDASTSAIRILVPHTSLVLDPTRTQCSRRGGASSWHSNVPHAQANGRRRRRRGGFAGGPIRTSDRSVAIRYLARVTRRAHSDRMFGRTRDSKRSASAWHRVSRQTGVRAPGGPDILRSRLGTLGGGWARSRTRWSLGCGGAVPLVFALQQSGEPFSVADRISRICGQTAARRGDA